MGRKNYLIEGVSGAGKTTVATELARLGYQAIHGDRELVYRGDPETGAPIPKEDWQDDPAWFGEHQIWDLKKVRAYVESDEAEITFFCGGSRNFAKFVSLLDGVFILDVDKDEMNRRIAERVEVDPTDFGATPDERALIQELYDSKKDIPKTGIVIDANRPLKEVVGEILDQIRSGR